MTAVVVAFAVGLTLARRRLAGLSGVLESGLMLIVMLALVWVGRFYRDAVIVVVVFIFGLAAWGFVPGAITAVVLGVVSYLVPGGTSVIVLGALGVISVLVGLDYLKLIERIGRAKQLTPG